MKRFLIGLLAISNLCFSQSRILDSLENALKLAKEDTTRLNILDQITFKVQGDPKKAYIDEMFSLIKKLEQQKDQGPALRSFIAQKKAAAHIASGNAQMDMGKMEEGLTSFLTALKISTEFNDKHGMAGAYHNMGISYQKMGDLSKALENYLKALKIAEEISNKQMQGADLNNVGNIFLALNNGDKAMEYYNKALAIKIETDDKKGQTSSYSNIGHVYHSKGDTLKAIYYYAKSAEISKAANFKKGLAIAYNNLGTTYLRRNDDSSLFYFKEALKLSEEIHYQTVICSANLNLADLYTLRKQYRESIACLKKGLEVAQEMHDKEFLKDAYDILADNYAMMGDYKVAFEYHKKFSNIKDSLLNEELTNQVNEMGAKYESEKKDREIELLNKDKALDQKEIEKQAAQRNVFIVGFVLVLIMMGFIFRGYKQKQKANLVIQQQKHLVEEKNKDITDSINYAKKIQEALLPARELKEKLFPDSFIFFQPRDIVSGDFYWLAEKNGRKLIAAVDCTGHGVPGAFMSMIGTNFLNEIVGEKGISQPGEILNRLKEKVIIALKQNESDNRDGMDISLLSFDKDMTRVSFSGANNPLWLVRNGICIETKANKQPIGSYKGETKEFSEHQIDLQKGDTLYIFTDGFADQFGGPKGKKFKYKQLMDTLASIHHEAMPEQEKILMRRISEWKGQLEQVDDVLVIGIRV